MSDAVELRRFMVVTGAVCIVIGAIGLTLGAVGEVPDPARADSTERFAGGLLIGVGALWIVVARQTPLPRPLVATLAATLLLAGLGRTVSAVVTGWPPWVQVAQGVVEIVVPLVAFALLRGSKKASPTPRK